MARFTHTEQTFSPRVTSGRLPLRHSSPGLRAPPRTLPHPTAHTRGPRRSDLAPRGYSRTGSPGDPQRTAAGLPKALNPHRAGLPREPHPAPLPAPLRGPCPNRHRVEVPASRTPHRPGAERTPAAPAPSLTSAKECGTGPVTSRRRRASIAAAVPASGAARPRRPLL